MSSLAPEKQAELRAWLVAFYQRHNPEKIDGVDTILAKFQGKEHELVYQLERKYAANVRVLRARRLVQWGTFSMVAIALDAIKSALDASVRGPWTIRVRLPGHLQRPRRAHRPAVRVGDDLARLEQQL